MIAHNLGYTRIENNRGIKRGLRVIGQGNKCNKISSRKNIKQ